MTTYRTRNVQQEKLEKQKKITVAKLLVGEKRISSAPKLSKRGGSWIWISTCWPDAPETKDSNNFRCTSEREREREREREKTKTMKGLAEKHAANAGGGCARCTKQTHCKTLVRSNTIYTPDTSTYYLKHVLYTLYYTIYNIYFWVLIYLKREKSWKFGEFFLKIGNLQWNISFFNFWSQMFFGKIFQPKRSLV